MEPVKKFSPLEQAAIEAAIEERRSVRAFSARPVARKTVARLLEIAARAPSGTNMQPWRVHVLTGQALQGLTSALMAALREKPFQQHVSEYKYYPDYYPDEFFEPFLSRRRKVGWDLYGLLGIKKGDTVKMAAQMTRNLCFFDAPVAVIFTVDRRLEIGSWLDYGYFLGFLSVAARAHGLETCSQAALAAFHEPVRKNLGLPEQDMVLGSLCLGYADWEAPVNALRTQRENVEDFADFRGFES